MFLCSGHEMFKKKKIVIIETMTRKLVPTARDYLEEPPTPSSNTFFRIQKHDATKRKGEEKMKGGTSERTAKRPCTSERSERPVLIRR